jgi:hypothetical protein
MTAAAYAAKKTAGLCTANQSCPRPATHGSLCKYHRGRQRKASTAGKARLRERRMLAGDCVSCPSRAKDGASMCQPCMDKVVARKRLWTENGGRARQTRTARKWRQQRIRRGKCIRCNRKRVTKTMCEVHRKDHVAKWRERTGHLTPRLHCSVCRGLGHQAPTCPGLPELPPLRIEDFATARREAA